MNTHTALSTLKLICPDDKRRADSQCRRGCEMAGFHQRLQPTEASDEALVGNLAVVGTMLGQQESGESVAGLDVNGSTVLYNGRRPGLRQRLRGIVVRFNGQSEEQGGSVKQSRHHPRPDLFG